MEGSKGETQNQTIDMDLREKALKTFEDIYKPSVIERDLYLIGMNAMCKIIENNAYIVFGETSGEVECLIVDGDVAQRYITDANMNLEAGEEPLNMMKITVLI